ncbi:DUF1640 domain-containing protein [Vibrio sp. 10N.261.46.E12]|uniref:DUF1640 domain-containing protein n=1 Tax=unclassified Vibrio TaxID=2614977 RepID=UPI0009763FD5|nr:MULTISPECIES: DUF1640 domain-containing protein [unclassified Vibrio]OMO35734.1 DUF1640 domain-containing protein [Vibrio sp. 10N.261.45.E1]PMJ22869.1 DUF1640 domain-containing protein [Vibrio sp. 10N.286.45.B6]PML87230.1 DUF1640 domain-containing protein [Vibrio sp. 10N.261.49.E11]PMM67511.1 DUF1640 domain-containing protein [Vibrio sp. 10N.261.46.F12]PMM86729.1 DUF1640 domain-containing protein [Vibrio sp. 10N.261.46.E8]
MSESSKVTLSVEELINLTAHAATQEQLNDTRKELDQKIETVRHEIQEVRNDLTDKIDSIKNLIIGTAFTMIATVAAGAFYLGSHLPS